MRKKFKVTPILSLILSVTLSANLLYSQKRPERSNTIPEDINIILRPFCYSCHSPAGGRLARSRLNFAMWNGYTPGKQVEKAASICTTMEKRTMPTKMWSQQNPGLRLTNEQIDIVCRWAESIRTKSKQKPLGNKKSKEQK